MVFSSYLFVFLFLPVFLTLYRLLPSRFRNAFLLASSLLFYAFGDPKGTPVLLVSVVGNFAFGLMIDRAREAGVVNYIVKPFRDAELLPAIEIAMARYAEFQEIDKKVGDLGKGLGEGIRNFKTALKSEDDETKKQA